jgi:hypothetical protein
MASITETGLGDASPYLLELIIAASLLATPAGERRRRMSDPTSRAELAGSR